ncbi:cadherin domain-containing protein [Blastopirellula sp. J2-11]|uniref:cadherin domain-containing protein n=1 Tax=Blastopirellula sp. J2-11 TaxID=2943192 RepID=UPI0021C56904|nr:cadherin domain-containing protein [Blastopirellula sp. J2-11]UUO08799.1 cadherin domain-containing protein [Blastopirellula sp. J2-11]
MKNTDWTRENNRKLRKHGRARRRLGQRKLASEQLELRELLALTTIDLVTDLTIAEGTHRDITLDHLSGPSSVLVGLKIKGTSGNFDPGVPLIHVKDNPSQTIPLVGAMANVNGTTDSLVFFQMGTSTLTIEVGGSGGGDFQAEIFLFGDSNGDGAITEAEYMKASAAQMQGAGTGNANTAMYYKSVWGIDFNQSQYDYEFDLNQNGRVEANELNWVSTNRSASGVQLDLIGDIDPPSITVGLVNDSTADGVPGGMTDGITNVIPATNTEVVIEGTVTDFSNITSVIISGSDDSVNVFNQTIAESNTADVRNITFGLSLDDLQTLFGEDVTDGSAYTLKINAVDDLGNTYGDPIEFTFQFDTTLPGAPTPDLLSISDSGDSDTDNLTNASSLSIEVTTEAGSVVELFVDGASVGTLYDSTNSGKVTFTLSDTFSADDLYKITAKSYDAAGNPSVTSGELAITIDRTTAEPIFTLTNKSDDVGAADFRTEEDNADFSITIEAGATVSIGGVDVTDSDLDGVVTFDDVSLTLGNNSITAMVTDLAGNTNSKTITVVSNHTPEIDGTSLDGVTNLFETTSENMNSGTVLDQKIVLEPSSADMDETLSYSAFNVQARDLNDDPVTLNNVVIVVENTPTGATVTISDPDGELDYELGIRKVTFDVQTMDNLGDGHGGAGLTSEVQSFSVDLNPLNETPVIADGPFSFSINEDDTDAFTPVAPLAGSVTDPEVDDANQTQSLIYSLSGASASLFTINSATGAIGINTGSTFDFETTKSYELTVTVSDGTKSTMTTVTVSVADVNEDPVFDNDPFVFGFDEDKTSGVVGSVTATDPDAADDTPTATNPENATLTYSFTGTLDSRFAIDSATGEISIVADSQFDYETEPTISLEVMVEDAGAPVKSHTATVTINIADINEAPEFGEDSYSGQIDENTSPGTVVVLGTAITATDEDTPAQTLTYSFATDGDGGGKFAIDPTTGAISLAAGQTLDHETTPSYMLEVVVTDNGSPAESSSVMVEVTVNNVNEAPVLNETIYTISELSLMVGDPDIGIVVDYTDVDMGDVVTFTSNGAGTGDGVFELQADGSITFIGDTLPDPDTFEDYTLQIKGTDIEGLSFEETITIRVTANLPPTVDEDTFSVPENLANDEVAFTLTFSDAEMDGIQSAVLQSDAGGAFKLGALSGNSIDVIVNDTTQLDFETNTPLTFTIRVTDNVGSFEDYEITVNLTDQNDAPDFVDSTTFNLDEFVAKIPPTASTPAENAVVLDLVTAFSDQDGDTLTYNVVDATGAFGLDMSGKNLIIVDPSLLDTDAVDAVTEYTVTVEASDGMGGMASQDITITIDPVNELPLPLDEMDEPIAADGGGVVHLGNITLSFADLEALNDGEAVPGLENIYSILNFGPEGALSDPEGDTLEFLQLTGSAEFTIAANGDITITDTDFLNSLGDEEVFTLSFSYTDNNAESLTSADLGATSIEFTITIVKNADPVISDVSETDVEIAENSDPDSPTIPVLTFNVIDPDDGDMITSVTASAPGIADGIFKVVNVSGSQYQLVVDSSANLDYEAIYNSVIASDTFTVTITANDSKGGSSSTTVDVTVTDVNEAPTMEEDEFHLTIPENSVGGTEAIGQVIATDPDAADAGNMEPTNGADFASLVYTLSGGDSDKFNIDSNGVITVKDDVELDFENDSKNSFQFNVQVSDLNGEMGALLSGVSTVYITVTDANDDPEWTGEAAVDLIVDESQLLPEQNVTIMIPNGGDTIERDGYELRFALSEIVDSMGNPIFTDADPGDSLELVIDSFPAYANNDSFYSYSIDGDELVVRILHYLPSQSRAPKTLTIHVMDDSGAVSQTADLTLRFKVENIIDVQIRAVKELSDMDGTGENENVTKEMLQESDASLLLASADIDSTFYYEIWISTNYGVNDAAPGRVYFDGASLINLNLQFNEDYLDVLTNTYQQIDGTFVTGFGPSFTSQGSTGYAVGLFGFLTDLSREAEDDELPTVTGNGAFLFPEVASGDYLRFASIGFKLNNPLPMENFNGELISLYYGDTVATGVEGNGELKFLLDPTGFTGDGSPVILEDTEISQNSVVNYNQISDASTQMEVITDFLVFELNNSTIGLNLADSNISNAAMFALQGVDSNTASLSGNLYVQVLSADDMGAQFRIVAADILVSSPNSYLPGTPAEDNPTDAALGNFGLNAFDTDIAIREISFVLSEPITLDITGDIYDTNNLSVFDTSDLDLVLSSGTVETVADGKIPGTHTTSDDQLIPLTGADLDPHGAESGSVSATNVGSDSDFSNDDITITFSLDRMLANQTFTDGGLDSLVLQLFADMTITASHNNSPALMGTVSANGGQPLEAGSGVFLSVVDAPTALDASGQIAALPVSETWLSEWDGFWVEIWANTADAAGIQAGAVDLKYNTDLFTATRIEYASKFDQNRSGMINDHAGQITNVGSGTVSSDLGKDGFVLLGRVQFQSLAGDGLSVEDGLQFGPAELGLEITRGELELSEVGLVRASTDANPNIDVWAVPYDLDDDGVISMIDLSQFIRRIGTSSIAVEDAISAATDFNNDGYTSLVDLSDLIRNLGISKANASSIKYPSSFTQLWVGAGLVTNGPDTIESIFTAANNAWAEALGLDKPLDVRLEVTNLGGAQLGEAKLVGLNTEGLPVRGVLTIDDDGAGFGWSTDLENGPGGDQYDLYTVMLHELGHLYGFMPQYSAFGEHVTDFEGTTLFVGDMYAVELDSRGEHLDVDTYASDVMSPYLAPGIRKEISALDTQMILTAYSSADSSTTIASHGAALTEQSAVEQPVNIVSPVSETSTVDVNVIPTATSFVLGDNVANLADVSGRTGVPVVMPETTRRTLEQSGIAFKTLSNYSAAEFDNVSEAMTEVETYFDDSTLIESTISDIDSDADDSNDGDSIDDLFAEWDEIEMA